MNKVFPNRAVPVGKTTLLTSPFTSHHIEAKTMHMAVWQLISRVLQIQQSSTG